MRTVVIHLILVCNLDKQPLGLNNPIAYRMVHWGSHELDPAGDINFHQGVEGFCSSGFRRMGLIEDPHSPTTALQALRIAIAGSVGTIRYQIDGFTALGVVRTVVELIVSKPASRVEVD